VHGEHTLLEYVRGHYFGKYRGTVSDNNDPTGHGRLLVNVPSVLGGLELWAMPCVPYAGPSVGFYSLPPKKSGVWVEFEAGDSSCPIWTGCFWADNELPDSSGPDVKIWKTDSLTIRLDDSADELLIQNGSGANTTYGDGVATQSGKSSVTVDSSGVVCEAGQKKVEVTTASVKINGNGLEVL
jgi:hypothetical protein